MKREKIAVLSVSIIIFTLSFVYFALITPTVPFDGDDWRYIGTMRLPIPLWGAWNPTRVLPEVLMPICGYIAAFIFYPFSGNYIGAITVATALVISLFVMGMFYCFYLFTRRHLKLTWREALLTQILFFLSFFLLYKKISQESYSMFWTGDLACDFYYLIPGLLNASVILIILQTPNFTVTFSKLNNLKKGFFLVALYFAIFSNTQLNIILATVCFTKLVEIFWNIAKNREILSYQVWRKIWFYVVILILWLLTIAFDLNGARAQRVQDATQGSLKARFFSTLNQIQQFVFLQNKLFLFIFIILILVAVIFGILKKESNILEAVVISIVSMLISLIYLLLAYMQAGGTYAARPDAMWAVAFFFLLAANIGLAYLIKYLSILKLGGIWPLVIVLLSLVAFNFNYQPLPPSNAQVDSKTKVAVNNYIINQIVEADKSGKASVVVKVPQDQDNINRKMTETNWPHSYDMEKWLQNTLYIHHIIRSRIRIVFKPERKITTRFYENKKEQQPIYPAE
ncbi:MAG: hypothetical protein ACLRX6_07215 [Limosilactobacillus pontis]|uniref:Uncharacterized protein n=1 Tax=Limosilactobacillus pontis TaxID=35787 RepID=A0A2J6NKS2_9LACO|nr:hypothetical protein [Limosilactobacillus pontis]PMB81921.1 hypothetical protein CK797_08550 [Limosilactobacillus pontis]